MFIFDLRTNFHVFRSGGLLVTDIQLEARIRSRTAAIMSFCIFAKLYFSECHPHLTNSGISRAVTTN